jgi:hypothetical protein
MTQQRRDSEGFPSVTKANDRMLQWFAHLSGERFALFCFALLCFALVSFGLVWFGLVWFSLVAGSAVSRDRSADVEFAEQFE